MADYTIYYAAAGLLLLFRIYNMQGGWPEAYYRIRRKPYFVDYIKGPDKRFRKHVFLLNIIQRHSPAMFTFGNGNYLVPDSEASNSASGAPLYFHNWDDTRPIPTTIDTFTEPDGSVTTRYRERIPPGIIKAGFQSKVAEDIHRHGLPSPPKTGWLILVALVVMAILIAGVLYYDYNSYCALHPNSCGGNPLPGVGG